jgi:hypothetical protein
MSYTKPEGSPSKTTDCAYPAVIRAKMPFQLTPDPFQEKVYPAKAGHQVDSCIWTQSFHPSSVLHGQTEPDQATTQDPVTGLGTSGQYSLHVRTPSGPQIPMQADMSQVTTDSARFPVPHLVAHPRPSPPYLSDAGRRYIVNSNITPSYYLDPSQPSIGNRPVQVARHVEAHIPRTILLDSGNQIEQSTHCSQPTWKPECI